jgi:hypothetical protein
MKAHPSRARRIAYALAGWAGSHDRATGAQFRGPILPGSPRPRPVNWAAIDPAIAEHNAQVDARRPEMGVTPGSPLAQLLAQLTRPDRRLLLATIQAAPGPRRDRMQRQVTARLRARGLMA